MFSLLTLAFSSSFQLNGLLILGSGLLSVVTFFLLGLLNKRYAFDDRKMVVFGLVWMFLSNMASIPYWGTDGLHLYQIILSAVCVAFGYPVASAICYALYSKVIAPVAQGDKMGYLTAGGSAGKGGGGESFHFSASHAPLKPALLGPCGRRLCSTSLPSPPPLTCTPLISSCCLCSQFSASSSSSIPLNRTASLALTTASATAAPSWGVKGYPGAWMFLVMGMVNFGTIVLMLVFWRRLVPHPDYASKATLASLTDDEESLDKTKSIQ